MNAPLTRALLVALTKLLVGASPRHSCEASLPRGQQRIYFANHTSHLDTLTLWAALPAPARLRTRPVAARDYWGTSWLRRFIALCALNAVLVDRKREDGNHDPLQPLIQALEAGDSLILFPEGTRCEQPLPGDFKAGLFHLAQRFPHVELVPVYLDNLGRSLPKGKHIPVPIISTVRFGAPLAAVRGEPKNTFLARAREAVVRLAHD